MFERSLRIGWGFCGDVLCLGKRSGENEGWLDEVNIWMGRDRDFGGGGLG